MECYHCSYVVYVVSCFSIGYCLNNNYMYHMTKFNLLLVVCRSWNHNIDVGVMHFKNLNVSYSLSSLMVRLLRMCLTVSWWDSQPNTWICIYLTVVNKQISFYLAALTNKINTLYLHYCIQYAIQVVFLFFLTWHKLMSERPLYF